MKKDTQNIMLIVGAAAVGFYFISKQRNGDGAQLPSINLSSLPQISIPAISEFQIPDLNLDAATGCGLGGLSDLGLSDLGLPDWSNFDFGFPDWSNLIPPLPTIPPLPDLIPDLPERKTWNPLWFLPDIHFDWPSITGLPSLSSLPKLPSPWPSALLLGEGTPRWLNILSTAATAPHIMANPLGAAQLQIMARMGYEWLSGGIGGSKTAGAAPKTSYESAGAVRDIEPSIPEGGTGVADRDLPMVI